MLLPLIRKKKRKPMTPIAKQVLKKQNSNKINPNWTLLSLRLVFLTFQCGYLLFPPSSLLAHQYWKTWQSSERNREIQRKKTLTWFLILFVFLKNIHFTRKLNPNSPVLFRIFFTTSYWFCDFECTGSHVKPTIITS